MDYFGEDIALQKLYPRRDFKMKSLFRILETSTSLSAA